MNGKIDKAASPSELRGLRERFGGDQRRDRPVRAHWPKGPGCAACGQDRARTLRSRLIYERAERGKQHRLLAETLFERAKSGFGRWFVALDPVTLKKDGISGVELQRRMGFGGCQTAWPRPHETRRTMCRRSGRP